MAIYGYMRISTLDQLGNTSLAEQERRIKAVALARNLDIKALFCDQAISGAMPLSKRPEGSKLIELLTENDTLIIARLDRGFRNAVDALNTLERLRKAKIHLIIEQFGSDSITENGTGRLVFHILAAVADWERENMRERLIQGRRAREAKGGFVHGRPPFGFKVVGQGKTALLEPDQAQQDALVTIKEALHRKKGLRDIVSEVFEKHGVKVSHMGVSRVIDRFYPDLKRKQGKNIKATNQPPLHSLNG